MQRSVKSGVALLWLVLAFQYASADQFQIVDQNGQPLANAVLLADDKHDGHDIGDNPALRPAIMDQVDKQFLPHFLVVRRGQAVDFPNSDDIRHHVYSFSKPNDFEIKLYSRSASEPVRFESEGLVVLGCNIHDSMKGYIFVTDSPHVAVSDEQGRVSLDAGTASAYSVWHSRLAKGPAKPVAIVFSAHSEQQPSQGQGSSAEALGYTTRDGVRRVQLTLKAQPESRKKQFRARFK